MTSINTNASATTALRTLQMTNKTLETTQNRVSTGLKIAEAKDNAAYWAISTTLKSDNKALSTVKDALGLGSATVDVAYQALNKSKEVLDEMKSKLVAASQPGVDKAKIQAELSELQKQLTAIATSASFSGENWLAVDSTSASYNATKQVVSGYTRDASGAVLISTIGIETKSMTLIDTGAVKEGILDGGVAGNTGTGGVIAIDNDGTGGVDGSRGTVVTGALTIGAMNAATTASTWSVTLKIDGTNKVFTGDFTGATLGNNDGGTDTTLVEVGAALVSRLQAQSDFAALADVSFLTDKFTFTSDTYGKNSKIEVVAMTIAGVAKTTEATTGDVITDGVDASLDFATFAGSTLALDANDSLNFNVSLDGGDDKRVTINKALVESVLPSSDGKIETLADMKLVMSEALRVAGLSSVVVSEDGTNLTLKGGTKTIKVSGVEANKGVDLTSFDMTNASIAELTGFIQAVNSAAEQVISAASTLGSVSSRIGLQKTFVDTLIDTIDKGVGELIDADLSEESTRLQALQTKQQLGIQALSIANSSQQNILRLFQ